MMLWAHIHNAVRARASEFALALILFNMSAVLVLNETLFADNPRAYAGLASMSAQSTWAIVCAAVGGSRLVVLMVNGFWHRSPVARFLGAFLSCYVWFQLTWGAIAAGNYGLGLAIYPVLLLFDSFNVFRTVDDAIAAARAQKLRGARHGRRARAKH